jgi:hypothetical protein
MKAERNGRKRNIQQASIRADVEHPFLHWQEQGGAPLFKSRNLEKRQSIWVGTRAVYNRK